MPTPAPIPTTRLLAFNLQVIDQALAVLAEHARPKAPPLAGPTGAHLRHVIEHYEALLQGAPRGVVDYDARPRDRQLEASAELARTRLLGVAQVLGRWPPAALSQPVQVHGQGGTAGDFEFSVASSFARELAFVASHAVHHFALMAPHLQAQGLAMPEHFGKAPGTVANEAPAHRSNTQPHTQESTCHSPALQSLLSP